MEVVEGRGWEVGIKGRAWACGFEDAEERKNTNTRCLLPPPFSADPPPQEQQRWHWRYC